MKEKDELLQIFSTSILIIKYEEDFSEETKYIENLKYNYNKHKENKNFRSTDSYLFKHEPLKKIKDFCMESLTKYTEKILNSKQRLMATQCWANKNPPGAKHREHVHPNSIVSGVFYLKAGGKLPPIQFAKDIQSGLKLDPVRYNIINAETFMLSCVPGELILFPSSLKHGVLVNESEETRCSLSFNTFCIDVLGSESSLTHLDIKGIVHENN
tara:strand:- start:48 stop:686 length:639 start_codon:yes stop_codon:yes gene_type:complete